MKQIQRPMRLAPKPPMIQVPGLLGNVTIMMNKQPNKQQVKDLIDLSQAFTKEMDKILA